MSGVGWEADKIATLIRMWDAGATAVTIAREIGCSKNAAIGKAHWLKLTPRPSPIVGVVGVVSPRKPRAPGAPRVKLPPSPYKVEAQAIAARKVVARVAASTPVLRPTSGVGRTCQYRLWGDKERVPRPPRFCGAAVAGISDVYCETCARICFRPVVKPGAAHA